MPTYPEPLDLIPTDLDPEQERALQLLKGRNHVILSGGGGTGKTYLIKTFLRTPIDDTTDITNSDVTAVVTPTGVAASLYEDEGAVTIYNLFGFPATVTPGFIEGSWRPAARKRNVLETISNLVIDEFSMVRADMFDMMDKALKKIRRSSKPFGGVRIILVGDPAQLPPIVKANEEMLFSPQHGGYASPYIVSSDAFKVMSEDTDVCILTRQHRQQDPEFAKVVSSLRAGSVEDIAHAVNILNTRVDPNFSPASTEGYVTFTATRREADRINDAMTNKLDGVRTFTATLSGDVTKVRKEVQAPENLRIAVGSQVMMLNNDKERRWVNGTVGIVTGFDVDPYTMAVGLTVKMGDNQYHVHRHDWTVTSPRVRSRRGQSYIEHEELGRFTQFPVLPSWATTIHKSQGRTCDRVILDVSSGVFAEGQAYVGVSRCTTLEGLALRVPLSAQDVQVPAVARWFDQWAVSQSPVIAFGATDVDDKGRITAAAFVLRQGTKTLTEVSTKVGEAPLPTQDDVVELVERIADGFYYAGDDIPHLGAQTLELGVDVTRFFDIEGADVLARARALASSARSVDVRGVILDAGPEAVVRAQYRRPCPVVVPVAAHTVNPDFVNGSSASDWFEALRALTMWCEPGERYYEEQAHRVGVEYVPA